MPLMSAFSEDFSAALDTTNKWTVNGTIGTLANARYQFAQASLTGGTANITAKVSHDLTGSSIFARINGFRDGAQSAQAILMLTDLAATPSTLTWSVENGNAVAKYNKAGTATTVLNAVHYPDNDAWFRIREAAGTTYWDTAPIDADNPPAEAQWVNRGSVANPIPVTALYPRLHGGTYDELSVDPGMAHFDAVNAASSGLAGYGSLKYVAIGAAVSEATAVSPAFYEGVATGDQAFLTVISKYGQLPATPGGWTLLGQLQGGITAAGVDSGSPVATIFTKVVEAEAATTTVAVSKATETGTLIQASIFGVRKIPGMRWEPFTVSKGADTTGGDDWSVTGDVALDIRENDLVFALSALNSDISTGKDERIISDTTTFGSVVEIRDTGTAFGDDGRAIISLHYATSNAGNVAPVYTFFAENKTVATAPAGPTVMVRLRAVPQVAAALAGAAVVGATASAVLSTQINLAGSGAAASTASAVLSTQITLGGSCAVSAASTGALTTAINMQGAANAQAALSAILQTQINLAGSALSAVSATGDVKMAAELAGAVAVSVATGTPGLDAAITMHGAANVSATGSGNLTTKIDMQGQATAEAVAVGEITTGIALAGTLAGSVAVSGGITTGIALAGSAAGTATASASLQIGVKLDGAANAVAGASGVLNTGITLAGAAAGEVGTSAALTTNPAGLSSDIFVNAAASGAITTAIALQATAASVSTGAASLDTKINLQGAAVLNVNASGMLVQTIINLNGSASASVAASAGITTGIALAGTLASSVNVSPATLESVRPISGDVFVLATGLANLATQITLDGVMEVGPFATADLTIVPGSLGGSVSVSASATGDVKMAAELAGAAIVSNTITGDIRNDTRLVGSVVVGASTSASITTAITMQGAAASQVSTLSATLQTAIRLNGSAQATVDAGKPALGTSINLAGAAIQAAQVSARLATQIILTGSAESRTFAGGQLYTAIGFTGHAGVSVSVPPASLITAIPLGGSAVAGVSVSRPELVRILRRIDEEFAGVNIDSAYNVFAIDPVFHPIEETP